VLDFEATSTTNANRASSEMGMENATPMIERLGREAPTDQYDRELWKNCLEADAHNIVIAPCLQMVEEAIAEGKTPRYLFSIQDDGCGMDAAEIRKFFNKLSSGGHNLTVAGGNYGLGAKISLLYWNPAGVLIMSWKKGIGVAAKIWKDPRPEAKTYGRYGLAPFELEDGGYNEFIEAPEEYKPDFVKDHGTMIILLGDGKNDTWQGPIGANGEPAQKNVYSHLLALNSRFFQVPKEVTTSIFSMKEKKEDWPRSEAEAKDRSQTSERKGNSHVLQGMAPHLLEDSQEHGTLEHPDGDFKIHWYLLRRDRSHISYHINDGFVGSLFQNEMYDLHRGRARASYMSQFGIFRGHVQEDLVLIVEPNPAHLMTDSARSHLIDARIYERCSTEKLPWNVYGDYFKANLPECIKAALQNLGEDGTQDITATIREEIKEYVPYMSKKIRIVGTNRDITIKPKSKGSGGGGGGGTRTKKPQPVKPPQPGDAPTQERNGMPTPPKIEWVTEAEDPLMPKGRAARYDSCNHILFENKDFPVAKTDVYRRLSEWHLNGNQEAEKGLIEAVRHTYSRQHIFTIMHHYQNKDTENWTSEEWELAVSPEALTSCVLGFKWAEHGINRYLATHYPELAARKAATKGLGKTKKIAKKIKETLVENFKTAHRGKKQSA